jgi:hypothetical protein
MQGLDPGTIALNFLTYFGGAGGAEIAGAAILMVFLLCAAHVMHPKAGWITTTLVMFAWTAAWSVRQLIGWA